MKRWHIFGIAFSLRTLIALFYYGSCDIDALANTVRYTLSLDLTSQPMWNYFPFISIYMWFAGWLSVFTPLPHALCIKILPIFFDALIALLIADIADRCGKKGWLFGLVYALNPVSIMVACIHGQWEAVFLFFTLLSFYVRDFFTPTKSSYFAFGALFAYGLLIKPISLMFLPFFFAPLRNVLSELGRWLPLLFALLLSLSALLLTTFLSIKKYDLSLSQALAQFGPVYVLLASVFVFVLCWFTWWLVRRGSPQLKRYIGLQVSAFGGMATMMFIGLVMFLSVGFDMVKLCDEILRYCNQGVQIFGLPFAVEHVSTALALILKNRIWLMAFVGALAVFYYQGRLQIMSALSATMLAAVAFCGLCPHYLVWPLPFLMFAVSWRVLAWYGGLSSLFLLFYYAYPFANPVVPFQNGLSFSPLFSGKLFFLPAWMMHSCVGDVLNIAGDLIIPILAMTVLWACLFQPKQLVVQTQQAWQLILKRWYMISNLMLLVIIGALMIRDGKALMDIPFQAIEVTKRGWYAMQSFGVRNGTFFDGYTFANIIVFASILIFMWSGATWKWARKNDL